MKFEEALSLMRQGKKVRRKVWSYREQFGKELFNSEKMYLSDNNFWLEVGSYAEPVDISNADVLADDWEEWAGEKD